MLASVYSYRVMVKSVSSCCVRGSRVLSNPVTYMYLYVRSNIPIATHYTHSYHVAQTLTREILTC